MTEIELHYLKQAQEITEDTCTMWRPRKGDSIAGRLVRTVDACDRFGRCTVDALIIRRFDNGKLVFVRNACHNDEESVPVEVRTGMAIGVKYFGIRLSELTGKPYTSYEIRSLRGKDCDVIYDDFEGIPF
jgi:hypothetical protein